MKIALVRQRYTPYGGAERFVSRAMRALAEEGAAITLVTRAWEATGDFNLVACNPFYLGSLWRDWGFSRCVRRVLKERDFDLVQSHERIPGCDVYRAGDGVHRAWLAERRRVLGPFGRLGLALNPYHRYVLAAEKALFAHPALKAVICNSHMVKEEIRHHFGVAEEKLHVLYSGVDTDAFHPRLKEEHRLAVRARFGLADTAPLFLFVGSGFERKGLAALLAALAQAPRDAHLWVVGKDKRTRHFERLARELGLGARVRFLGPQADVKPLYGAADALILPTLYDPFPNVALEAMASGLPLVTSTKSGAAELITAGQNGYVCDALDTASLAALLTALHAPARCRELGENARKTVEPLTLDAMGKALLAFYRAQMPR